jgi:RNA polymerase sigma-70 factor (sigma-E family)
VSYQDYVVQRRAALFRFAVVLSGDPVLAEDVVQNVLGRAFELWPRIDAVGNPHAYIRRMVVNEYLSWRRRLQRTSPSAEVSVLLEAAADHAQAHAERIGMVEELRRLPRRQRAVLVLRYYEDLDDSEIADLLGCAQSTVRSYAARALATLRVELTPHTAVPGNPITARDL